MAEEGRASVIKENLIEYYRATGELDTKSDDTIELEVAEYIESHGIEVSQPHVEDESEAAEIESEDRTEAETDQPEDETPDEETGEEEPESSEPEDGPDPESNDEPAGISANDSAKVAVEKIAGIEDPDELQAYASDDERKSVAKAYDQRSQELWLIED